MNKKTAQILWFKEVGKKDISIVGGKGANLGEMVNAKIPVPDGFVVTAGAYFDFINSTSLKEKIMHELSGLNVDNSKKLQEASKRIKTAIMAADMPGDLAVKIKDYYHKLCGENDRYVAVRSSATAEDLPDASFAGQQETYLNVKGWSDVVKKVQECWASLFEARAIFYRETNKYSHLKVGIAVPVQLMVQSDYSGIMFTVNPLTNSKEEVSIEAAFGLGQPVVSGEVTPDQYIVNKKSGKITSRYLAKQTWQLTLAGNTPISKKYQQVQKLTNKQIVELAHVGMKIEEHYKRPQDIEYGIEDGKIYIVQSRPVTTLVQKETEIAIETGNKAKAILEGLAASPGVGVGKVKIVKKPSEINIVKEGDVLVAEMTNPDYVPAMKRASAIVTDLGGRTSHAAIVSRELGIPAIVGTSHATKILRVGELITVDGAEGKVYEGDISEVKDVKKSKLDLEHIKTATKIYMNLAEPELATEMSQRNVDGVGLLRAEFIMAQIGKHPMKFIKEKKQKEFINQLADGLEKFAEAFYPRPVVYRFNDFKSNEYANLTGGKEFETEEPNPMIGYRGVSRYLKEPEVFEMEVEAIKRVRNKKNLKNLWVMMPFVRTVEQFREVKKLLSAAGLRRSGLFKFWMMVEIPSNVILLDEFLDEGIDGVSIGTNDLTMLTLGVDRDNEKVADAYSEMNPAVLQSLEKIVTTCRKRKVTCSVCGQAPSVFPELVEMLVDWGVTSVSVSPDVIEKTREIVYNSEKKVLGDKKKK
ncbi:phosphoenolpyruvate synthase [candidate division WWE3 bacterium RIFOXYB1_FULL_43_24]|uniref:Phosphoenolpyruvate synthase n=1 Tax=candidate division WWE3 bacterium GW2011_GWF1_42_14 TaxID=1619138 RepID=A0A0G0YRT3_UNCKA|nr:MAG: Phosphoenolpyruvate synthase [candidate division WWE3 bacterium GW2011_GWA1_42_12]KKS35093.1 MAG: Phosphoenolpyruvate synthase [candidate division WWE3 bacterium GW2011_GWD1_42_14]KKS39372.1 MAG: Phosphoenolpyruvate synthase [candidate division WWE3 bacterium GW2011_GWF1_42_14]KKS40836.1 MAG: Phosphoenolpyruvate synthase [candidate division WWE3 bacterium GW2011_GWE1_42_16]OGC59378.1 MAG: phosphoenolpyruvate synthase [candidate division WWE3 bacterium RIFOXYA1_FULL_42_9]OGC69385.1 MAG: